MRDIAPLVLVLFPLFIAAAIGAALLVPDNEGDSTARLECVTGDAAKNPVQTGQDGRQLTMPITTMFETISEAEAFICLDVPQAGSVPGWVVQNVGVSRSHGLEMYESGMGFRALSISYSNPEFHVGVDLRVPGEGVVDAPVAPRDIEIQGTTGKLWIAGQPEQYTIQWTKDGNTILAFGALNGSVSLQEDILPFLETVN